MKPNLFGTHSSYKNHRRQFWLQIFLPMILMVVFIFTVGAITGVAAFSENSASPRWGAISTIWLVIPVMFFGLIFLVILASLVYLLGRTLQVLPPYSSKAQYYLHRAASEIKQYSDKATEPVLFIEAIKASLKAVFGRK